MTRYHVGFEEGQEPQVWTDIHDVPFRHSLKLWTVEAETPAQAIERASMLRNLEPRISQEAVKRQMVKESDECKRIMREHFGIRL